MSSDIEAFTRRFGNVSPHFSESGFPLAKSAMPAVPDGGNCQLRKKFGEFRSKGNEPSSSLKQPARRLFVQGLLAMYRLQRICDP